jgi:hypothetical protein
MAKLGTCDSDRFEWEQQANGGGGAVNYKKRWGFICDFYPVHIDDSLSVFACTYYY